MRLLKIIVFLFAIYLIRRFFQMYKVMKEIQRAQETLKKAEMERMNTPKPAEAVEADFKVIDP